MRKKILLALAVSLIAFTDAQAHKLILGIFDNGDDTITVSGKYDTGGSAAGARIRLEALESGAVLYEARLPRESELTLSIPDQPYQVVLDGGPGHLAVKEGIPPEGGFAPAAKPKQKAKLSTAKQVSMAFVISSATAVGLLFLTLLICRHNTNRILAAIAEKQASRCERKT